MTYIDKRALQNGESELSLTPYVNLNQVIQDIIDPQVFPTPSDDISFSTQIIGNLDISELNGQYFTALDLGVFSTTNSLEDVAKDIPPCKFGTMVFTVIDNTANEDIVVWLLSGEDTIGSITVPSEETGEFKVEGNTENPEHLSICFNITEGNGEINISEITTTFTTGEPIVPPEPPVDFTAGNFITIDEGRISFGGSSDTDITANSIYKIGDNQFTINRKFGTTSDETNIIYTESSINTFDTVVRTEFNSFNASVTRITTGLLDIGSFELAADALNVNVSSESNETSNYFSITPVDVTISAYPNIRNDFPIDPPVNLLCTNEDGKIQSYNTGVQAVVIIPGVGTLRFINGILVDYLT